MLLNGNTLALSSSNISFNTRTITSSYTVVNDDYFIGVDTNYSGIVITLPTLASTNNGKVLVIKDVAGVGATNIIKVSASSGQLIDLDPFTTLDIDFASISAYKDTTGWFVF